VDGITLQKGRKRGEMSGKDGRRETTVLLPSVFCHVRASPQNSIACIWRDKHKRSKLRGQISEERRERSINGLGGHRHRQATVQRRETGKQWPRRPRRRQPSSGLREDGHKHAMAEESTGAGK
jgi:hypothetical protein